MHRIGECKSGLLCAWRRFTRYAAARWNATTQVTESINLSFVPPQKKENEKTKKKVRLRANLFVKLYFRLRKEVPAGSCLSVPTLLETMGRVDMIILRNHQCSVKFIVCTIHWDLWNGTAWGVQPASKKTTIVLSKAFDFKKNMSIKQRRVVVWKLIFLDQLSLHSFLRLSFHLKSPPKWISRWLHR